jgi:acyl-CoA synthetase (AMP-forming)/AMP-acid ligase II
VSEWSAADVVLSALPLSHLTGFVNLAASLARGATVVPSPDFMWTGQVIDVCIQQGVTVAPLVPYYLSRLVRHPGCAGLDRLRLVVVSTAPGNREDVELARRLLPDLRVLNAYGLTEALRSTVLLAEEVSARMPSIGRPVPGVEIELRTEDGRPLASPVGEGVAWIRGPNVMSGYWERPADNRAALRDGWFCTGDVMRRDADGYLWIVGRLREQLQGGGEKLSPEVLERLIAQGCPASQVAVFGIGTTSGFDEIVAVVVAAPGATVELAHVRAACAPHVHSAFVPARVVTVPVLPRTASGKVERGELRRSLRA